MLRFLLLRPIAVIMLLVASLAIGVISFFKLPVSLLPDIDVPEITISVQYPNSSPEEIEQNILKPIRESLLTMNGLKSLESIAQQETGLVSLQMQYGIDMDLAYIEANEKIDRLTSTLPAALERPRVVRTNSSDIPVAHIQVVPAREEDYLITSELASNVLKRRLEQLEGVGLVDINGVRERVIRIAPDYGAMGALGITDDDIIQTVTSANLELGSLTVRDGNYRYFLRVTSRISRPEQLAELPVKLQNSADQVKLNQIARIYEEPEAPSGFHLFNIQPGIVIKVHKQAEARLPEIMPEITNVVQQFREEYPGIGFHITQDQSQLLTVSIQNLSQALVWGGIFAFVVLFLFMGGWREPLVMGIVLPMSLVLSFSLLYLFDLSLNIISLSGLALGLGMLVDNSIVVIDNIVIRRKEGLDLIDSCVRGTQEVITPLVSSALTNLAVFIPLIFLSGITGALFYDQAIAVSCILFVSILCTFVFVPLLYMLLNRNKNIPVREDSRFFKWLKEKYRRSFQIIWRHKFATLAGFSLLIIAAISLAATLPKEGFPAIERKAIVLDVDWNEPIPVHESRRRIEEFLDHHKNLIALSEADIGTRQFILDSKGKTVQQAELNLLFESEKDKTKAEQLIREYFLVRYPQASISQTNAPNAFEQLFISRRPVYEIRLRDPRSKKPIPLQTVTPLIQNDSLALKPGKGFETESMVFIEPDFEKMQQYGVNFSAITQKLKILFGNYEITSFKNFGDVMPVLFSGSTDDFESLLRASEVVSENGATYPLGEFVHTSYETHYKNITADAGGIFQGLLAQNPKDDRATRSKIHALTNSHNLTADYEGTWFESRETIKQLAFILIISLVLMYFIITAEFESFTQPLIVMSSIPIGFAGSLVLLWLTGGTINVMSGIGLVVVLGILDNDAILKIDRINALRKLMPLEQAIHQAGLDRFKPIVMNTCTNVLAITPIIFSTGLGGDLQRPVAITTVGGLIVATFTALYYIPILCFVLRGKQSQLPH